MVQSQMIIKHWPIINQTRLVFRSNMNITFSFAQFSWNKWFLRTVTRFINTWLLCTGTAVTIGVAELKLSNLIYVNSQSLRKLHLKHKIRKSVLVSCMYFTTAFSLKDCLLKFKIIKWFIIYEGTLIYHLRHWKHSVWYTYLFPKGQHHMFAIHYKG